MLHRTHLALDWSNGGSTKVSSIKNKGKNKGEWRGTPTELLGKLNGVGTPQLDARPPGWPRTPKGLSSEVARIEPNLKAEGVEVIRPRRKAERREIVIRKK